MVEKLINAILTFVGEVMQGAVSAILGYICLDKKYIDIVMPGFKTLEGFITTLGFLAVMGCLVTAAIQMVSAPITGQEKKGGVSAVIRALLAGFLVPVTVGFAGEFMSIINKAYNGLLNVSWDQSAFTVDELTESANFFEMAGASIGMGILSLIFAIVLFFQMFKLAIALLTRFVTLVVCLYLGPLCVGFFASPATTNITVSWLKTMLSQSVLILTTAWGMHVMFISLLDSSMYNSNMEALTAAGYSGGSYAFDKYVMVYFLCKVLIKLEDILRNLGFNPFPTGANVRAGLGSVVMMGMTMARAFSSLSGGHGNISREGSSSPASADGAYSIVSSGTQDKRTASGQDAPKHGYGGVSDNKEAGMTRKQYEQAKTGNTAPETPREARIAANEAFMNEKEVKGSILNKASEGTEGYGRNWKFEESHSYKMDENGFVQGPMLVRSGNEWKEQDRVTDFSNDGSINNKEFIGSNGEIRKADTKSHIAIGMNDSIRSYPLYSTGETVSSRNAKKQLSENMSRFGQAGYNTGAVNISAVKSAFSGSKNMDPENGNIRIPDSASVKQISDNELRISGGQYKEYGTWKDGDMLLNMNESRGVTQGKIEMSDGRLGIPGNHAVNLGGGTTMRTIQPTGETVESARAKELMSENLRTGGMISAGAVDTATVNAKGKNTAYSFSEDTMFRAETDTKTLGEFYQGTASFKQADGSFVSSDAVIYKDGTSIEKELVTQDRHYGKADSGKSYDLGDGWKMSRIEPGPETEVSRNAMNQISSQAKAGGSFVGKTLEDAYGKDGYIGHAISVDPDSNWRAHTRTLSDGSKVYDGAYQCEDTVTRTYKDGRTEKAEAVYFPDGKEIDITRNRDGRIQDDSDSRTYTLKDGTPAELGERFKVSKDGKAVIALLRPDVPSGGKR